MEQRVSTAKRQHWYWRFLLVLGIALAIDFLVDAKLQLVGLALLWIAVCFFSLWRIRRAGQKSEVEK